MNNDKADKDARADAGYFRYGLIVVSLGLGSVIVALTLALYRFSTAADVAAVVGTVTGAVGAICGAYFGIQVASGATAQMSAERKGSARNLESALRMVERSAHEATLFASAVDPTAAARILEREELRRPPE